MQRSYLAPSYGTAGKGEAEALDLLADILGGGATSRMYRQLVVEKGVAAAAGAGYHSTSFDETRIAFYGVPRGDVSLDALAREIDALIAAVVAEGVTDAEVASAKRRIIAGATYARDSHSALARAFGQSLAIGKTLDEVKNWPAAIDAVTADQVNAVARKYLDIRRSVTGYLTGAPAETRS
jgi:zinc protease